VDNENKESVGVVETKVCTNCGKEKALESFKVRLSQTRHLSRGHECTDCINERLERNHEKRYPLPPELNTGGTRVCSKCGEEKRLSLFKVKTSHAGTPYLAGACVICLRDQISARWRKNNPLPTPDYDIDQYRHCEVCDNVKPVSAFKKDHRTICRECYNMRVNQEYREKHGLPPKDFDEKKYKRCTQCQEVKPLAQFHLQPGGKLGLKSWCTTCANKTMQERFARYTKERAAGMHPLPAERTCNVCGATKKISAFGHRMAEPDGRSKTCKRCCRWKEKLKKYGLSASEFYQLLDKQIGACAICKKPFDEDRIPHVDHDHRTGAVRSLLCLTCNMGLGALQDSPDLLRAAATYLESHANEPNNDAEETRLPTPQRDDAAACAM